MADAPDAPAEAPKAPESEQTPTTTNAEQAPASTPDMHGFTSDELADIRKFFDANGSFEKIKSKISNPEPKVTEPEKPVEEPTSQPQAQAPQYKTPAGAITTDELMAKYYFESLSRKEEYAPISKEIADGVVITEMAKLGIPFRNQDGSWNDEKISEYLSLRAKTVPANPTSAEPNASAAPTVTYTEVGENGISNIDQAYKIIMEPGNPNAAKAEEFIKNSLNKK